MYPKKKKDKQGCWDKNMSPVNLMFIRRKKEEIKNIFVEGGWQIVLWNWFFKVYKYISYLDINNLKEIVLFTTKDIFN